MVKINPKEILCEL